MTAPAPATPPSPYRVVTERSQARLAGKLVLSGADSLWAQLRPIVAGVEGDQFDFEMSGVEVIDGSTMALLVQLRTELIQRGVRAEFVGASPAIQRVVHLYHGDERPERRRRRRAESMIAQIGRGTHHFIEDVKGILGFLGTSLLAAAGILKEPRTGNWRETLPIMERAGADAVPIVVLINFLVGFVMAFQGANQLKQFGANIYVADLVGLSLTRELAPLMTAIIVCGRSGAAFAAELGSMTVSEEIDALRTLGFGPIRYLVLPRTLGLVLVVPFLTLLADFVGIVGGLFVGITTLDLTVSGYLLETQKAVSVWDVSSGLVKSVVFAIAIALIACQQGFSAQGGAEGVGRKTTSAVVSTLFALILIDAGFTIFFHAFNL